MAIVSSLIPSAMNDRMYSCAAYLGLPMQDIPNPNLSTIGITADPTSLGVMIPQQSGPFLDQRWIDFSQLDALACADNCQVNSEPTLVRRIDHDGNLRVAHSLDMCQPTFPMSTLQGSEGFVHVEARVMLNQDPTRMDLDGIDTSGECWRQEELRGPGCTKRTGRRHTAASLPSSRRPTSIRRAHRGSYLCNTCGKRYAQLQGVRRHQRETHQASLCMYCLAFEWGRPYLLREHLEKEHPGIDLDAALDEAMAARRRATIVKSLRRQRAPSLAPENDTWDRAESQPHPQVWPPPTATKLTPDRSPPDEAECQNGIGVKVASVRTLQSVGVAPNRGGHRHYHARGSGLAKDASGLVRESTD
ncbi:hypothetical protein BC826DRAFT_188602 [Russula brevipes]|nr:hypothetical protein BC826DRAFT_188602 [Russula brevipes]